MPVKPSALPPLLFGETDATRHVNARSLGDEVQRIFPGLNAYEPVGSPKNFFAKSYVVKLRDLSIVASAISPTHVDRDGKQTMTLMFPLVGDCHVSLDGNRFEWAAGRAGVFMPEFDGRIVGAGNSRSLLMLNMTKDALERTARAMFGLGTDEPVDLRLDEPRQTPVTVVGCNIEPVLRKLGSLIDMYRCDPLSLSLLGFDELLYRHVVGMLSPQAILSEQSTPLSSNTLKSRVTDRVCDEMMVNLDKHWTLTDIERMSGLSARALQYAFKARFGCSPMDWLREQRLQLARHRLLLNDYKTITQLAQECGFGTASQFSAFYKARFGVTPKQT